MGILSILVVLGAATVGQCAVAAPAAIAAIAAPRIFSASFSGNGCPASGTKPTLSGDSNSLVVSMPDFAAQLGGGASPMNRIVNCEVHLNMDKGVPRYKLAVKTVTAEGYMFASPNVTMATYATVFWSENASNTVSHTVPSFPSVVVRGQRKIVGERREKCVLIARKQFTQKTDVASDTSLTTLRQVTVQTTVPGEMASKCLAAGDDAVGILNVNFRATLSGGADGAVGAFVGMDGGPVTETIEFSWVPCEAEEVEVELPAGDKC